MMQVLICGLSMAAITLLANVETASADHCRSGYGQGYSNYGYSSPYRSSYQSYRYSSPNYGSYYRNSGNYGHYGHNHRYGNRGQGVYIQGRNFGFGLRY
ncbi:MAG: hypothetical protein P8M30_09135 [Planctomycetaceae bacterium]|nr:hypothetical protein [Planctomycetaceae bacterium]